MDIKKIDQELENLPNLIFGLGDNPWLIDDIKEFLHKKLHEAYEEGHAAAITNKNMVISLLTAENTELAQKAAYVGKVKREWYMRGIKDGRAKKT